MDPSLLANVVFVESISTVETTIGIIGFCAAAAFIAVIVSKIGAFFLPRPRETRVADFLPFRRLREDGMTIECQDNTIVRVFKLKGKDMTLLAPKEREILLDLKKRVVDNLSESNITARFITLRKRVPVDNLVGFENKLLSKVAQRWQDNLDRIYTNEHHLILSVIDRDNAEKDLEQCIIAIESMLDEFVMTPMYEDENSPPELSPFHLFANIASPLSRPSPKVGDLETTELNGLLTADYIHFTGDKGLIKFIAGENEKLGIVMGMRSCGDYIDEQMVADLLSLDVELTLLHNIKPKNKAKAAADLIRRRQLSFTTSVAEGNTDQFTMVLEAMDSASESSQTIHEYAMTLFVFAESMEELKFGQIEVERLTRLHGVTPVRDGWVAEASFFAQFPTYEIYPRTYLYLSRAIGCALCLETSTEGLAKSDWGDGAIAVFRTVTGTAYKWQFHVSTEDAAVAHAVIIGPTGQGKTTLLAFLAGQAMRHSNLRVYFFDRHKGVEIFTKAIGGAYVNFDGDKNATAINPLSAQDTPENRAFLRRWIKSITMATDSYSEREIARAVTTSFDYLDFNQRTLKNLYKSCFSPTGHMRRELYRWINDQQYGRIFNSPNDDLDMTTRFMAFDFTHIFEDELLAPAVISYVMHRINTVASSTGDPSLVMIDETAPMLKHPMFRDSFIVGLQEGRKKRQAFLCAFQQPNIVDSLGLGEVIRGQCQTVIFFKNPQGMEEDYENWRLTPREKDFIFGREFKDLKYGILVSRPAIGESVILDVNLGPLGPYLKLYSSGRKHVVLAEQLMREFGEENFVQKYLEMA